ncbi:hypothetical protein NA57DRAFT_67964 [Rhizodiscina lignyota]|uniref:Glycerophosphocholine acyltransferase 1 n=1 Tax=Rhizodiscina lignyota TaxID=1504668 RepID=A0A9P4IA09_9PEZI|nr:hypothetical protein NA57DRAFT_67964 [Rhizodiscina lignyota]
MSDPLPIPLKTRSQPDLVDSRFSAAESLAGDKTYASSAFLGESPPNGSKTPNFSSSPPTPGKLSRTASFSNGSAYDDDPFVPPPDRITVFDLLENLALPQRLEQLQSTMTESVRRQQQRFRSSGQNAKDKVIDEWRRRLPTADEQLGKYRKRMRERVDRIGKTWNDRKTVSVREKVSFIAGVFNIFISGYFIGSHPEWFHLWYAAQLVYFMPIRFYTYHRRGMHYFLADLCYFVNGLLCLSIWAFPNSKRLLLSTFCLAYGNNAIAIAMWRNMLVFHSLDKVTSLFIHIMPCVTLHCLVHLIPPELQAAKYPAIYRIKNAPKGTPFHYSPAEFLLWASVPYALWQATYYFFITWRRKEKIAAGRLTSFVWLRRSYKGTMLGNIVHRRPEWLQEPTFMLIQYFYAMLTTLPCALWFWYRYASAGFLTIVFAWSVYNGATYYIDIFGRRFERELEQLRRDVQRMQNSPDGRHERSTSTGSDSEISYMGNGHTKNRESVDHIPLLDESVKDVVVNGDGDAGQRTPTGLEDKKNA